MTGPQPRTIGEERDWARLLAALESIAHSFAELNRHLARQVALRDAAEEARPGA